MPSSDKLIAPGDITTAIALLTRLPVRADIARGAQAAWAYPIAGVAVALPAALLTGTGLALGLPPMLASLLWVGAQVMLTGAMHEDGLADCADGFWGGWDRARRLEIMKDSRIGAYGVIALCLGLAARWVAVGAVLQQPGWLWPLLAVAILSRAPMTVLMARLPNARDTGLSHAQGRPSDTTALAAITLATAATLLLTGWSAPLLVLLAGLAALTCATLARAKIGGQTGDVLGATQQVTEITLLCALSAYSV